MQNSVQEFGGFTEAVPYEITVEITRGNRWDVIDSTGLHSTPDNAAGRGSLLPIRMADSLWVGAVFGILGGVFARRFWNAGAFRGR